MQQQQYYQSKVSGATGQIVHKVTADALIHFFASNEKLAKLLEQYEEAQTVGLELVGREELMKRMQKKADELIISYEGERKKRSKFQYDIGVQAKREYAQTSLERASFVFEIRKLLTK
jgi:DNA-binding transcriptional regulator YbjK